MLTETGLKVEEFANNIISLKVPIDELGLLMIARMYHTHFGVVLKDRVWYTTEDNSSKCSKFLLVYQGGVSFSDTCTANWNLPLPPTVILVLDEDTPPQQSPVNLVTSPKPCETTASSVLMPLDMRNKNELEGDQKMDSDAQNMDFDDQKEDCQKADSQGDQKLDSEDKMDYGDCKEDSQKADLNNDKIDCDAEKMDFDNHKEDSQNGKMDSEDNMDHDDRKEDCDKANKVDSNMSQSQKEECKECKSEKRQSRPWKRPQTSSRCLRSSPSASNKCIKISQTSVTPQKAGLCPVDLDDFFRARRSHTPPGRDKKKCNKQKMTSKPCKKDRKKKHKAKANAKHEEQRKQKEVTSSDDNHEIETEHAQDTPENQVKEMPETEAENINTEKELAQDVHEEQPERQEKPVDVPHGTDELEHEENAADVVPHGIDEAESEEKTADVPHGADEAEHAEKEADVPHGTDQAESQEKASDVSASNERRAKPENLLEPDPILKAFEKVHTVEEAVALLEVSDNEKPRKSIAVETKIETNDGVMNVKLIGLKAPNKKDQKFTCH